MKRRLEKGVVETAGIAYRVADFLKQHAPFHAVDDADLLALAANGRVRFFEPNEFILWQGEPHRLHVFVIQQGTVSLWEEASAQAELCDVRGAGDMLGTERYNGARSCLYSARSESDVVIYSFPSSDFEQFVLKYPDAATYVAAEGRATADYQPVVGKREPQRVFLREVIGHRPRMTCLSTDTIADAARRLLAARSEAIAVLDAERQTRGVLTADALLAWIASGAGSADQPVEHLLGAAHATVAPDASVADAVLAMATAGVDALAVTDNGGPGGQLQAIVAARDLAPLFGEQPTALLREIDRSSTTPELRELNRRSRAFVLASLTGADSVEWLARFTHLVNVAIVTRLLSLSGDSGRGCWCFCAASGRGEALTLRAPYLLAILEDGDDEAAARTVYHDTVERLAECDFLPRLHEPFDEPFHVASVSEWTERYRSWVADPLLQQTYLARSLFDLRAFHGRVSLWQQIETAVMEAMTRDFLHLLANDCLDSLPPLTFFQDAVVDSLGQHRETFQLEKSAVRPLVDVGRVFGMAARKVMGRSTLERFATARTLLPEHQAIFREAADSMRIVLWQQARVGISQGTSGSELPPTLLSRHDRQVLKGGFRAILRLVEFTADRAWLKSL